MSNAANFDPNPTPTPTTATLVSPRDDLAPMRSPPVIALYLGNELMISEELRKHYCPEMTAAINVTFPTLAEAVSTKLDSPIPSAYSGNAESAFQLVLALIKGIEAVFHKADVNLEKYKKEGGNNLNANLAGEPRAVYNALLKGVSEMFDPWLAIELDVGSNETCNLDLQTGLTEFLEERSRARSYILKAVPDIARSDALNARGFSNRRGMSGRVACSPHVQDLSAIALVAPAWPILEWRST